MKTRRTLFITAGLAGTLALLGCPPAPTPQQQGGGMGQGTMHEQGTGGQGTMHEQGTGGQGTMHDQGTGSGQRMMDGQGAGTGPGATTPPPK